MTTTSRPPAKRSNLLGAMLLLSALWFCPDLRAADPEPAVKMPSIPVVAPATNTPIARGFLQTDLNGNGQAITNAVFAGNGVGLTNLNLDANPAIAASVTNGTVYYVSTGGNDLTAKAGRRDRPWRTVYSAAAAAAACGRTNTVYVESGTYNESNHVYLTVCNSLVGEGRDTTIINLYSSAGSPLGDFSVFTVVSNSTVSGVTINMPLTNTYEWISIGNGYVDFNTTGTGNVFRDCNLNGTSDVFWLQQTASAVGLSVVNCKISSKWDTFANTGGSFPPDSQIIQILDTEFVYDHTFRPAAINGHNFYTPAVFNLNPYYGDITMQNCSVNFISVTNCAFANQSPAGPEGLSLELKGVSMRAPESALSAFGPDVFASYYTNKLVVNTTWQQGRAKTALTTPSVTFAGSVTFSGGVITNNGMVWHSTNVSTPTFAYPNGSIATTSDGGFWIRTNNTWVRH